MQLWGGGGGPRLIIGGPPCTPFSHAGFWIENKRTGRDPARELLASYVRALEAFQPDAFVLENVPGLAFRTHSESLLSLRRGAARLGYVTTEAVLCASDFSVAQARRRL